MPMYYDNETVLGLRAALANEDEAVNDVARKVLRLTTDNPAVRAVMGSRPACAEKGCQFDHTPRRADLVAQIEGLTTTASADAKYANGYAQAVMDVLRIVKGPTHVA